MLTSKERATFRAQANGLDTIGQVGKDGVTPAVADQMNEALEARELVKFRVLDTSPLSAREAAEALAVAVNAEVIQVIGARFVLYRESKKSKK